MLTDYPTNMSGFHDLLGLWNGDNTKLGHDCQGEIGTGGKWTQTKLGPGDRSMKIALKFLNILKLWLPSEALDGIFRSFNINSHK